MAFFKGIIDWWVPLENPVLKRHLLLYNLNNAGLSVEMFYLFLSCVTWIIPILVYYRVVGCSCFPPILPTYLLLNFSIHNFGKNFLRKLILIADKCMYVLKKSGLAFSEMSRKAHLLCLFCKSFSSSPSSEGTFWTLASNSKRSCNMGQLTHTFVVVVVWRGLVCLKNVI